MLTGILLDAVAGPQILYLFGDPWVFWIVLAALVLIIAAVVLILQKIKRRK